ncbi:MAG: nitrile hydratase accessory protein [Alphaproteobacteria bacterium]
MAEDGPRPLLRDDGPAFAEPWQAQALALAVQLEAAGAFTASEWAEALGAAIRLAQAAGDPDDGTTYYRHVLVALESLVRAKGMASAAELSATKAAWQEAFRTTPHGKPVELKGQP